MDNDFPNLWKPALIGLVFSIALFGGAFGLYAVLPRESGETPVNPPSNVWAENGSRVEIQYAIVDWDVTDSPYWWVRDRQPPVWEVQASFFLDHLQIRWVQWDFECYLPNHIPYPYRENLLPVPPEWDKVLPNDTWEVIAGDPEGLYSSTSHVSGHGVTFQVTKAGTVGTMYLSFILPNERLIELSLPVTNGTYPVAEWLHVPPGEPKPP